MTLGATVFFLVLFLYDIIPEVSYLIENDHKLQAVLKKTKCHLSHTHSQRNASLRLVRPLQFSFYSQLRSCDDLSVLGPPGSALDCPALMELYRLERPCPAV